MGEAAFRHRERGGGAPVSSLHRTRGRWRHLSRPVVWVNASRDNMAANVPSVRRMSRPAGPVCLENDVPAGPVMRISVPLADPYPLPRRRAPPRSGPRGTHRTSQERSSVLLRPVASSSSDEDTLNAGQLNATARFGSRKSPVAADMVCLDARTQTARSLPDCRCGIPSHEKGRGGTTPLLRPRRVRTRRDPRRLRRSS